MSHPNQTNIDFADEIRKWGWEKLIAAHKFYALEPKNRQAVGFCVLLEREMTSRACLDVDKILHKHGITI